MTVGIADVAALLELVLFRRRQEFSTGLDAGDPIPSRKHEAQ
jgi:hypothetical protein